MKTPKQLRHDIQTLTTHLSDVQAALARRADIKVARIGKECKRTADALGALLKSQRVPDEYKVAVVGRFKAGKSFFVNELLGNKLASEGVFAETAAITTFRHGPEVKANIRLVDQATWANLKDLHSADPKQVDAHRVRNWTDFATPKKTKEGEPEKVFDLKTLERQYVHEGGYTHTLVLPANSTKKATTDFRRALKEFTSSSSPLHCLVDKIDITAPAEILDQGVLLIDTPGLDDTERFRVSLTEKVVADVDAVLFLTKSGASYGQSEKDFLLSLLRKGTVRQLIVVITQIDETYSKILKDAEGNDEDPESIAQCIARERALITTAIAATLKELPQDDSLQRYQEQLGEVPIAFTSASLHRDWKERKTLPFAIDATDPGGVEALNRRLLTMLRTESRLAQTSENILNGARNILLDLQSVLIAKLRAIHNTPNKEVAEQKLGTFRDEFGQAGARFEGAVEQQIKILTERLVRQAKLDTTLLDFIGVLADQPLTSLEMDDVCKHWRTRRSGYWGYMHGLQGNVANQIFPKVQQLLGERTQFFASYAVHFETQLSRLAQDSERIAERLDLGASVPLDVKGKLQVSLKRSFERAQEHIAAEEQKVLQLLDDFVSDEVSERISARRRVVTDIWDVGTVVRQNLEVKAFYREIKDMLKDALRTHLKESSQSFGDFLLEEARGAPRDALNDVQLLLEQAADNIVAATTEHLAELNESAESLISAIDTEVLATLELARQLQPLADAPTLPAVEISELQPQTATTIEPEITRPQSASASSPVSALVPLVDASDWCSQVQQDATVAVGRLQLKDGTTGWPYEKLFEPRFLTGALRLSLVDPRLSNPHQLRNLQELLLHVAETARPKEIEVVTSHCPDESPDVQARVIQEITGELFKNYGVALTVRFATGLHDRWLVLDNGVLFKLGRGLDVYKPAVGLAAHRPALRRVRATEIDVFVMPGHSLVQQASR